MSNPIISQFFRVYNGVYDIMKSRTAKFDFSVIFVQLFSFWDEILIIIFLHCSKIPGNPPVAGIKFGRIFSCRK